MHGWPYVIHRFGEVASGLASAGSGSRAALAFETIALMDALNIKHGTRRPRLGEPGPPDIVAAHLLHRVKGIAVSVERARTGTRLYLAWK